MGPLARLLVLLGAVDALDFEVDAGAMVRRHRSEEVHVAYGGDLDVLEGLKASISSCVEASKKPAKLVIHVMAQKKHMAQFRHELGLTEHERVTKSGARIKLHQIPEKILQLDTGTISDEVEKQRGQLDDPEVYARIYMDEILQLTGIVVWLDADTIVQRDVGELCEKLRQSGKTVGFVDREMRMFPGFLTGKCYNHLGISWEKLKDLTAYNTGVYVANLERWKRTKAAERFQELVRAHNSCPGGIWKGGSQPPLTLTFQLHPEDSEEDFTLFEESWNTDGLGLGHGLSESDLKQKFVLHWSGLHKPWKQNGNYRDYWRSHLQKFAQL
ncbi:unnamed protein product [Effrenium voratum]|nr:unnamed protein product [Effrenium voratum]